MTVKQDGGKHALAEELAALGEDALAGHPENVGRLAAAVERRYPGRGFITIGGSPNGTIAVVRAYSNIPILCITSEPRPGLAQDDVGQPGADIEKDFYAGNDSVEARPPDSADSDVQAVAPFGRLDSFLGRHPRFQPAKVLKLDTGGMNEPIILGALGWIAAARPVLLWTHDLENSGAGHSPALDMFRQLFDIGYRTAAIFDNRGVFIETLSLEARQQLDDVSGYFGGEAPQGSCSICAFHEDDIDIRNQLRLAELESRGGHGSAGLLQDPSIRVLTEGQLASQLSNLTSTVHDAIALATKSMLATVAAKAPGEPQDGAHAIREAELRELLTNKTVELQAVRAHVEADRYRLQAQVQEQEKRITARELEIQKLQVLVRDLLAERSASLSANIAAETDCVRASKEAKAASAEIALQVAEISGLKARLTEVQRECAELKHDMANSLALRAARSLGWFLSPIRALLGGRPSKGA